MDTRTILRKVKDGSLSIEEAELAFGSQPYAELGYAKLDENRKVRQGFPEVIYCSNKPDDYLVSIYCKMFEENGAKIITLGNRILRTETVALSVLSIIMYELEK